LPKAKQNIRKIERIGLSDRPVCIAKTQNSFSDDPRALGRPQNFTVTVREIEIAAGAGFTIPIMGNMLRMPGLPSVPAATGMDIDNAGRITGLS
jgi:formate--tetrahydrofolate ligase